jgi:hypothetical protein
MFVLVFINLLVSGQSSDGYESSTGSLHRDSLGGINHLIIVSHGCALRAFMMMWLHQNPEVTTSIFKKSNIFQWFELEPNPANCSVRLINSEGLDGGYIWGSSETCRKDLLLGVSCG